jgi:hypothetical protein
MDRAAIITAIKKENNCDISGLTGERFEKYVIMVFSNNTRLIFECPALSTTMWLGISYNLAKRNAKLSGYIAENPWIKTDGRRCKP